jgi:4-amino-4-deoxy-L-arabinose transferase-like glycosyltransferase
MGRRPPTRKALVVGALLSVALVLRVAEVQRTAYRPVNDAGSYLTLASQIAHTGDYSTSHAPGAGAGGSRGPSAYFPPAYPYFLAAVDLVTGHTAPRDGAVHSARLAQAVLGTVTVALVGLVAWEAFGELVGLIALGLAAVYPVLIELSGTLWAENLMTPLVLAAVWAGLRAVRSPRPHRWIAAAGLLTGLATLTHVNGILLLVPLSFAAWRAARTGDPAGWRAAIGPTLVVATALLTLVPWIVRNAVDLHRLIPVSDQGGITLAGTYNRASAANPGIPYKWRLYYGIPGERRLIAQAHRLPEPVLSARLESQAFDYIATHPAAPLAVIYHNSLRLLELEGTQAWRASAVAIGLPEQTARIGVISLWVLCLLALAGAFTRVARDGPRWLWLAPVLLWLSIAVINAETPRLREPVDPFLILLAACALANAARAARRLARAPVGRQGGAVTGRPRQPVHMVKRLA